MHGQDITRLVELGEHGTTVVRVLTDTYYVVTPLSCPFATVVPLPRST